MTYAHKPGTEHLVLIPAAPWFVRGYDSALNVLDPLKEIVPDLETIVVVPCRSGQQAQAVARILARRVGMADVVVSDEYPVHRTGRLYVLIDAENADWFEGVAS